MIPYAADEKSRKMIDNSRDFFFSNSLAYLLPVFTETLKYDEGESISPQGEMWYYWGACLERLTHTACPMRRIRRYEGSSFAN